jgi:hypothetical protein
MQELVRDVFTAPLGTIFVLAGVLFLFIAVVGKISGKIEPGQKARVLSGVLGSAFITIGLGMYWWSLPAATVPPTIERGETKITKVDKEITPPSQPPGKPQGSGGQQGDTSSSSADSAGENIPDWVPVYPGAKADGLSIKMREGGGYGSFFFKSNDGPNTVINFYAANLKRELWEVKQESIGWGIVTATNKDSGQSITVTSGMDGPWKYLVTFSESNK